MASLINTIVTKFTAEGAEQTASATDNVTKAQTRLGNSSASSGRQFAAQSQGLGGLVAAYAGAAANIFAITQAYEALSKAARIDQTIAGTKALASQIGESGSSIIASIQKITNGQLSIAQSAEVANIALSAGFDSKQLQGLTEVAFKASRVLGRDLTDSIQRVIKGTAKLEPELLDELGIFTRIEPAVEKYATRLGVTAASLTEFQRRQAFANAAIEEGQRKFGVIAISANSTQASFERVAATFSDLAQKIGSLLAGTIAPALDFLAKNTGNALLAIGLLGSIVFKNLFGQIGDFVNKAVTGLEKIANSSKLTNDQLTKTIGGVTDAQDAASVKGVGRYVGPGGVGTEAKSIMDRAKAGSATNTQMQADVAFIKDRAIPAQQAYIESVKSSTRAEEDKTKAITMAKDRITALSGVQAGYTVALDAAGAKTKLLTTLTIGLQTAVSRLAIVMGILGTALSYIGIVIGVAQIVGSIFDIDILGAVGTAWSKLFEASKNLKAGIEGIVGATLNASGDRLRGLFNAKEIEEIAKGAQEKINTALKQTEEQITRQQDRLAALNNPSQSPSKLYNQGAAKSLSKDLGNLDDAAINNLNAEFSSFGLTVEKLGGTAKVRIKELKEGLDGLTTIKLLPLIKDQSDLENQLSKADFGSDKYKELLINLEKTRTAIEIIKKQGDIYGGITGSLSALLDNIGTDKVYDSLRRQSDGIDKTTKAYSINGVEVGKYVRGQLILNKSQEGYAAAAARAEILTYGVSKALDSGSATSEALSKEVNGSVNALEQFREATNKQIMSGKLSEKQTEAQVNAFLKQKAVVDASIKSLDELTAAERITRNIEKQFSTERQAYSEGVAKGFINSSGQIAKSEAEVTANRLSFLTNTVKIGEKAVETLKSNNGLFDTNRSKYEEQVKAGKLAVEAAIGGSFKLVQDAKKINDDLDKRLVTLQSETKELEIQTQLSDVRLKIAAALADAAREEAARQSTLKNVLESNLKTTQARIDSSKNQLSIIQSQLEGEQAIADARARAASAGSALAVAKAERQGAAALGPLQLQQQAQQALPNLFSTKERLDLATNVANIEYANAIRVIELKKAQAGAETQQQLTTLNFQQKRLEAEKAQKEFEIKALEDLQKQQKVIDETRATSETKRLSTEIASKGDREKEIQLTRDLELQKIASSKDNRLQEIKLVEERVGLLKQEAEVFQAAINGNKDWVNTYVEAVNKQFGTNISKLTIESNFKSVLDDIEKTSKSFQTIKDDINAIAYTQSIAVENDAIQRKKILDANIAQTTTELGQVNARIEADKTRQSLLDAGTLSRAEADKKLLQDKLAALEIERGGIKTTGATKIEQISAEADAAKRAHDAALLNIAIQRDSFLRLANEIAGIIGNNLNKGVDSFFDAIKNGTLTLKTFRQGVVGVFRDILFDIAKAATKELLIKPITDAISSALRTGVSALFDSKTADAIVGPVAKASAGAAGDLAKTAAGAATGQCGCISDALSKVGGAAEKAAGGAAESAVAPAAVRAAESTVTPAANNLFSNPIPVRSIQVSPDYLTGGAASAEEVAARGQRLYDKPIGPGLTQLGEGSGPGTNANPLVVEGAQGATTAPILPSGAFLPASGAAAAATNVTPSALGSIPANSFTEGGKLTSRVLPNQGGGGTLEQPFGPTGQVNPDSFNAAGQYKGLAINGVTPSAFNSIQPSSIPYQAPTTGAVFGNSAQTGSIYSATPNVDPKVMEDFSKQVESITPKVDDLGRNFETLNTSSLKFGEGVVGAGESAANLTDKTRGLSTATETMIPKVDQMSTATGMVAQSQGVLGAATGVNTAATVGNTAATQAETSAELRQAAAKGAGGGEGGGFFSSIVSGISSFFGFGKASGGIVQNNGAISRFAAGGGVMMRDRIPSLLEPGEFVMKKTSVDSIGRSSMERMNATGKSSGSPTNIKIQVDNSGQPKEAQQGETQFDGETAIVKLILKDLSSNGPIRRSIRGNT